MQYNVRVKFLNINSGLHKHFCRTIHKGLCLDIPEVKAYSHESVSHYIYI